MIRHNMTVAAALALVLAGCGGPASTPRPPATSSSAPEASVPAAPDGSPENVVGAIVFAADAGAGDALTDPVDFGRVETRPQPMDLYLRLGDQPVRRIVATHAHERCPVFSPDGGRLAYLAGARVVVVPLDGDGGLGAPELTSRLASPPSRPRLSIGTPCPQWSPDARHLAYRTGDGWEEPVELHVLSLDGEDRMVASLPAGARANRVPLGFAWSPDGDAIAYTTAEGVRVAPLDGTAPELVWRPDIDRSKDVIGDHGPMAVAWSPNDELAVTVRTGHAVGVGWMEDHTVHVVDLRSGREQRLQEIHEYDSGAVWSPDGSRLAFVGPNGRVRVHHRVDGSTTRLAPRLLGDVRRFRFWDVAWSPDGQLLLALARGEGSPTTAGPGFALVTLAPATSAATVVTPWTFAMDWINMGEVTWRP